jgi:protein O-mannosyl-transferase
MWCWVRWVRRPSAGAYVGVLTAYALALLAKPMVVTLPIVLLLLDVWPLERRVPLRRRIVEQLPLVLMAGAVSVVTLVTVRKTGGMPALGELGVEDRVATSIVAYAWYVEKTLWPSGLAVFYPLRLPIPFATLFVSAVFVGGVTLLAWRMRRTRPWLFVGWFWYLVTLLPVIGLVRVGRQAVADRYSYVPGIGLTIIVAWTGVEIARAWPSTRRAMATLAIAALVALGVASRIQVGYWRNDATLYERALAVTQDNFVAHTNYGSALLAQGRVGDALHHYEEALRIDPRAAQAHANVGSALATRGDAAGALAAFDRALALDPRDAGTHVRAADVLAGEGRVDEAIAHYETAAALEPDSAAVHNNLGFLLAARGRLDEAVAQYDDALRTEPDLATAHNNLALALEALGRRDEALRHYARAVELAPDDAGNRLNRARALLRAGRDAEAAAELREALRRRPDAAPAAADLVRALPAAAD